MNGTCLSAVAALALAPACALSRTQFAGVQAASSSAVTASVETAIFWVIEAEASATAIRVSGEPPPGARPAEAFEPRQ